MFLPVSPRAGPRARGLLFRHGTQARGQVFRKDSNRSEVYGATVPSRPDRPVVGRLPDHPQPPKPQSNGCAARAAWGGRLIVLLRAVYTTSSAREGACVKSAYQASNNYSQLRRR